MYLIISGILGVVCVPSQGCIDIYWFPSYLRQFILLFLPQYKLGTELLPVIYHYQTSTPTAK